jgi:hypothetical protein
LEEIESATKHFDPANKIGEGGFGPVYKVKTMNFNILFWWHGENSLLHHLIY